MTVQDPHAGKRFLDDRVAQSEKFKQVENGKAAWLLKTRSYIV